MRLRMRVRVRGRGDLQLFAHPRVVDLASMCMDVLILRLFKQDFQRPLVRSREMCNSILGLALELQHVPSARIVFFASRSTAPTRGENLRVF